MIQQCTCKHSIQDELHGKQMRVHTEGKDNIRCTVCGPKTRKQFRLDLHTKTHNKAIHG